MCKYGEKGCQCSHENCHKQTFSKAFITSYHTTVFLLKEKICSQKYSVFNPLNCVDMATIDVVLLILFMALNSIFEQNIQMLNSFCQYQLLVTQVNN